MKFGFVLLVMVLVFSGAVVGVEEEFDIIIRFEDISDVSSMKPMNLGMHSNDVANIIEGKIKNRFTSFNGVSAKVGKEEYERLMNDPNIKVTPNYKIALHLFNSTEIMNATNSWNLKSSNINLTGTGQTVCILDSGINYSHSDFGGCTTADFTSGNCAKVIGGYDIGENDNDPMDYEGHGTHVSGIVAANGGAGGIAKGANIVMVKVFDDVGNGVESDIISGIEWCTNNASEFNISVITASIGFVNATLDPIMYSSDCDADYDALKTAIDAAVAQNITVLFSSGNSGSSTEINAPSCISSVIPISSTTKADTISSFSDRNDLVKLFATGGNSGGTTTCSDPNNPSSNFICSTGYQGGYLHKSGTSMSAPMVAGAIAIISQYLNLVGITKTPSEVETVLYDTGLQFIDGSNNFSRIDVYSALLSLDVDAPNVTLVSPVDNHVNLSVNQSFVCNATDWQLANVTLRVWNSSGVLYNESNLNLTGTSNETSFSLTNMSLGEYAWNCFVYDYESNLGSASANFSLTVGGIEVELNSPVNNSSTNVNVTNFNCSAQSDARYDLTNITFNLWNSSNYLLKNETRNISGFENVTIFNYTFENEDDYLWECIAYNNNSNMGDGINFSINYDVTSPLLSGLGESVTTSSGTVSWTTSESANSSIWVNGGSWANSSDNVLSHSILVSGLSSSTGYNYVVTSCDEAGNCGNGSGSFTTSAVSSGGGGGGGGSSTVSAVYIKSEDLWVGASELLEANDKMTFSLISGSHSLKVEKVGVDFAEIVINSEPVYLNLSVGEEVKLNLSSSGYYDLIVGLNGIVNGRANVSIKRIFEVIVVEEDLNESEDAREVIPIHTMEIEPERDWRGLAVVVVLVLVVVFALKRKKVKGGKTRKKNGKQNKKVKAETKRKR
jgi:subtilisin family serine protease